MRIIRSIEDIQNLEGQISEDIRRMAITDFQHMVYWIKARSEDYDPDTNGISIIVEKGDSVDCLKYFGIENLNDTFPETIDEAKTDDNIIVKTLIICNNEYSILMYLIKEEADIQLVEWIEENKSR